MMKNLGIILFTIILTENVVLVRFLGASHLLGGAKSLRSSLGMGVAVTLVMALSSAATYGIQAGLLDPLGLGYLQVVVFILVTAAVVQLAEFTLRRYFSALHQTMGGFLPLITATSAVLGVALLNFANHYNFAESVVDGLGAGLGFMLAMALFSAVRRSLLRALPPKAFEGLPITLIAAALTSLTLMGFSGIV